VGREAPLGMGGSKGFEMQEKSSADGRVSSYGRFLIRWRWPVILATLAIFGWLGSGGRHIRFAGDYRIFFSDDNPLLAAFEELQGSYSRNENVLIALAPRDGRVFTAETLAVVEELTAEAWQIPHSTRVDSLANFQHTRAEGDELIVEDLISDARSLTPEEVARIEEVALGEPRLRNRLISPEGHVTAVNVLVQHEGEDPEKLAAVVAAARALAERVEEAHPGIEVHLAGAVMLHNAFMEATQHDLATIVPLMYLGIVLFMVFFLRSLSATFATLVVIVLSAVAGAGFAGWTGVALTPVSAVAPTLIMTLAVADSIHILMTLLDQMRWGLPKREAIVESLRVNFQPVFLTSVTTAIGFLSMNSSDAPPLRDLGNVTAAGIAGAFVASVIFLPALMSVLPLRVRPLPGARRPLTARLAEAVIRHRRRLLFGGVAAVLLCTAFIPANELDETTAHYFDESVTFRRDADFVTAELTGFHQVEFSLDSGESGGVSDPGYLATLDEFTAWWHRQPEVVHVDTFSDVTKRLNRSLHGDDPEHYRVPASRELAAQYLLLYELSLPYGLDLTHQVNIDKSATRYSVTLGDVSSEQIRDVAARGEAWLAEHAPALEVAGVGPSVMFAHLGERNSKSMILGTVVALFAISLCLVFALRSLRFGLLSLVPNLVPAAVGFGVWGLLVGQVGFLLSIVLAMTLGIVVDDTVHFLSKYVRARRERGLDPEAAVRYAFGSVGKALIATTVILVGGFLILSMSSFVQNSEMGRLTAMIIVLALVADFFLLPPLLLTLDGDRRNEGRGAAEESRRVAAGGTQFSRAA